MADNIGTAYVQILPSMKGFNTSVEKTLSGIDASGAGAVMGEQASKGFAGGMAKSGIVIGTASVLADKAFGVISSSLGRAISRVDTMNNFPNVMSNMGISSDVAQASISKLSDQLTGLPTALDTAVAGVQRFTSANGDLEKSTDMFLAVNDAILAGGAPMMQQASALEQLSQSYAKGQMDMAEWRTLQSAMPAQLNQIADAMGLTTEQLGAGLRKAGKDANYLRNISMDEFIDEIMRLDKEGGSGFSSFEEQARAATGGIQTSMANLETAVARGVANVIEGFGQQNISGAINYAGSLISDAFKGFAGDAKKLGSALSDNKEIIKGVGKQLGDIAPLAIKAWVAFKAFKAGKGVFTGLSGSMVNMSDAVRNFGEKIFDAGVKMEDAGIKGASGIQKVGSAINGLSTGTIGVIAAAIGAVAFVAKGVVDEFQKLEDHHKAYEKSTQGVSEATQGMLNMLGMTSQGLDNIAGASNGAKANLEDLWESQASHSESLHTIADSAMAESSALDIARSTIEKYAGKSDLSTEQQGKLKAAIDQVNEASGKQYKVIDAANGVISDSEGKYDKAREKAGEYKDEILKIIDAQKLQIQQKALGDSLSEMYQGRQDALNALTVAMSEYNSAVDQMKNATTDNEYNAASALMEGTKTKVEEAQTSLQTWDDNIALAEEQLGSLGAAASGVSDAFTTFATDTGFSTMLQAAGQSTEVFKQRLDEAGFSVEDLSGLSSIELANLADNFDGTKSSVEASLSGVRSSIDKTNAQKLLNKVAHTDLDVDQLVDAQGKVYTWNGTILKNQKGEVVTDTKQLADSNGQLLIWNGSSMKQQRAVFTQSGFEPIRGNMNAWTYWHPATKTLITKQVTIKSTQNVGKSSSKSKQATGGLFKRHAMGGFITSGVTYLGRDVDGVMHIAGEAGREWVQRHADGTTSIVPIENKRYLWPYAETIASMIFPRTRKATRQGGSTINVSVSARTDANPDEIASAVARRVKMIQMARGY